MQAQDEQRRIQWTESLGLTKDERKAEYQSTIAPVGETHNNHVLERDMANWPVKEAEPVNEPEVYLTECASCGGQFPSFRAICAECEDIADVDGYRDGKKHAFANEGTTANS